MRPNQIPTKVSPAGIASTTFRTVPDTPFNTFELTLPEGERAQRRSNGRSAAAPVSPLDLP